jgi:polygalacturonase
MSEYNVRVLGGIGDGVSDDGPVLAEAARRCAADGGGTILVPPCAGTARTRARGVDAAQLHEAFT